MGRAALVLATLMALVVPSASAAPGLTRHSPPHGGYSVLLPSNWLFVDASYPSDHATHLWWAPANALMKMEVVLSGCIGCATTNTYKSPNPAGVVPAGATSKVRINKWEEAYLAYGPDDPYPDNGVIIVTHKGSTVTGWTRFDLWLPQGQHKLATRILNSVRL